MERAKGLLQQSLSVDEDTAYRTMLRESRQRRKSMREIAEAIILGEELRLSSKCASQIVARSQQILEVDSFCARV